MTGTAADVIAVAKGEIGYHEGWSNGHWNNHQKYSAQVPGLEWSQDQAWCCTFVAWCAMKAGVAELFPKTAGCSVAVDWFKNEGRFSEYPAVGAQVFYGPGGGSHTGIVTGYDDTYVYTVEGNTNTNGSAEGDGVYAKTRVRRDSFVYGYGYPKYAEGIKSADPAYASQAPAPKPVTTPSPAPAPKPIPAPAPAPKPPAVSLSRLIYAAQHDPALPQGAATHATDVHPVEAALKAEGLLDDRWAHDGSFGSKSVEAYANWQRRCGYSGSDADGIPGRTSLEKLGAKHGFTVTP